MWKLSLIVPVYNEANHLEQFLKQIDSLQLDYPKELVFIDDASTDNSLDVLQGFSFKSEHQILSQKQNQGKGAALNRGIQAATGSIIGIQDADFEYQMQEIPGLIKPIVDQQCDIVFGSRFKNGNQVHRTFHYLVNRLLTLASNFLSGLYFTDMETCYKFFRADILQNIQLESQRFGFEPEITAKIARLKVRIKEQPVSYFPRNYIEGKKITWRDGIAAIWHIIYFNLISNPKGFFRKTLPQDYIPHGRQWL